MKKMKLSFIAAILLSMFGGCDKSGGTNVEPVPDNPGGGTDKPSEKFTQNPVQSYEIIAPAELATKECYFLSLLRNLPEMKAIVSKDDVLSGIESAKFSRLSNSTQRNDRLDALSFSTAEIQQIGDRFASLWEKGNAWDRLVANHLSPSGCYYYSTATSEAELLRQAWQHDAGMINKIVATYGTGTQAAHCEYSIKEATDSDIDAALSDVLSKTSATGLFGDIALSGMYYLLKVNDYEEEPTVFEPLTTGCNKAACEKVKTTDFSKYDYSAIVVLGGSDNTTVFHPQAQERCEFAYTKWKAKKAPFIIVTGGRIHPFKAKQDEAETMKKYLMDKGIPESVIIMEPHARHTPTNFRNTARLLWRYGFPFEKEALMVMQWYITDDLDTQTFRQRCIDEFGFTPMTFSAATGDKYSLPFLPLKYSLTIGLADPLDP